jgi:hypothetical protein
MEPSVRLSELDWWDTPAMADQRPQHSSIFRLESLLTPLAISTSQTQGISAFGKSQPLELSLLLQAMEAKAIPGMEGQPSAPNYLTPKVSALMQPGIFTWLIMATTE